MSFIYALSVTVCRVSQYLASPREMFLCMVKGCYIKFDVFWASFFSNFTFLTLLRIKCMNPTHFPVRIVEIVCILVNVLFVDVRQ